MFYFVVLSVLQQYALHYMLQKICDNADDITISTLFIFIF